MGKIEKLPSVAQEDGDLKGMIWLECHQQVCKRHPTIFLQDMIKHPTW